MGHFGARPIRLAWFGIGVSEPGVQLCRAGRYRARRRVTADNILLPFARAAPGAMIALATVATVIASQSIITGLFHDPQAIQLGWFHAHHPDVGRVRQIYVGR